jgi:cysteine desulfuration protein SufE
VSAYPSALQEILDDFDVIEDREERAAYLLQLAEEFREVPISVAGRPFPEEHRVQRCQSDAYVWAEPQPDNTLKFHFAVENPQGVSAKAMSVILDKGASGAPLDQVARIPTDIVFRLFGREVSMGKGEGLMGIVAMVQGAARERLEQS